MSSGVSPQSVRDNQGEERYRTLFNLAPIAVYSCDASGVILDYNNRAAELWGRKPALGDTDERFCGSFKLYRPDGTFMPHERGPTGDRSLRSCHVKGRSNCLRTPGRGS
jgi:PAS domain-containing protein